MKSIYKSFILLTVVFMWTTVLKAQTMQTNTTGQKVVIQLSSNDTLVHKSLIRQLNNILNAFETIRIEVVVHGPGIEMMMKNARYENNLQLLHKKGIKFLVCQNTMKEKQIKAADLNSFTEVIPAGIAHIIIRQSEGWSYIKAGF
ncbi:MAG: DsrE family protein [Flavisolibacter sp.]|nr:DsrE family protein [Flavisolibacter sp.]